MQLIAVIAVGGNLRIFIYKQSLVSMFCTIDLTTNWRIDFFECFAKNVLSKMPILLQKNAYLDKKANEWENFKWLVFCLLSTFVASHKHFTRTQNNKLAFTNYFVGKTILTRLYLFSTKIRVIIFRGIFAIAKKCIFFSNILSKPRITHNFTFKLE